MNGETTSRGLVPRMETTAWLDAGAAPALRIGEVHVWRAGLGPENYAEQYTHLSADERQRAEAFHFARDRERYVAARATLRTLLGGYLGRVPGEIEFVMGAAGKPSLTPAMRERDVRFNVSHSNEVGLFAFALGVEVGVDVEYCRADVDLIDLARRFFSPGEFEETRCAPAAGARDVFYSIWSRKEACLKATGEGLRVALDSFTVKAADSVRVSRVHVPTAQGGYEIVLYPTPSIEGYRAALASWGGGELVTHFMNWRDDDMSGARAENRRDRVLPS